MIIGAVIVSAVVTFTLVNLYTAVKMRDELAAVLKEARSARGLSLEAVSGAADISQGYLHKLEAGRVNNPSPRVLQRLAEALDASYAQLMELSDYVLPERGAEPAGTTRAETAPASGAVPSTGPTFTGVAAELTAIRAEIGELAAGQQRILRALERLGVPDDRESG